MLDTLTSEAPVAAPAAPVRLTPRAAEAVRKIMTQKEIPDGYGLRVGVKGGAAQA